MSLELNLDRVKENVRRSDTEDLLDRATVYRDGMEPAALEVIDEELRTRGVGDAEIAAHRRRRSGVVVAADGLAVKCVECARPAVVRRWGWHRLWMSLPLLPLWVRLPIFPRPLAYCQEHLPPGLRQKPPFSEPGPSTAPPPAERETGIMKPSDEIRPTSSD